MTLLTNLLSEIESYDSTSEEQVFTYCRKALLGEFEADLFPGTLSQESLGKEEYLELTQKAQIVITKEARLINNLRFILTKIVLEPERVLWKDIFSLYEIFIRVEELALVQPSFLKKFGATLKVIATILMELDLVPNRADSYLKKLSNSLKKLLPEQFLIQKRNLHQFEENYEKSIFFIKQRSDGTLLKYIPPKTFIGKGYGDKGTARKPEEDGSPTWQEVANHKGELR